MSKLLLVIAMLAMVAFSASIAIAGDYHIGDSLICSDCHTMHFSRSHDMAGGTNNEFTNSLGAGGPFLYLLKDEPNNLCLQCHDGETDVPDVVGAHANGYDRSGGAVNTVGGVDTYQEWMGHTLGSTAVPPGYVTGGTRNYNATKGLKCISCHYQHGWSRTESFDTLDNTLTPLNDTNPANGKGAYRNLSKWGPSSHAKNVSFTIDVNDVPADLTKDFRERYGPGSTLAQHYAQDNINLLEPVATKSCIADFCKSCHTNFHGATGGAEVGGVGYPAMGIWLRHPAAGADIGGTSGNPPTTGNSTTGIKGLGSKAYRVRVMSPTGNWGTQGTVMNPVPTDLTPTCLSCHKAHGNGQAFGLICATGAAPIGEDGDSTEARKLCQQCHIQGYVPPTP